MTDRYRKSVPSLGALKAQGDSVRQTWGRPVENEVERRPLRRDPPPLPPELAPSDDPLLRRLAEEVDYARRLLDQMGDKLSTDPILIARHVATLQTVDIVGQMLGHVAAVIRAADREAAVARIGMAELRARLTPNSLP